jgi:integrase
LALSSGIRAFRVSGFSRMRGIDPDRDINWQDATVHVLGKFKKERWIPMQPDALAAVEEQLDAEGKLWRQDSQRLRDVVAQGAVRAGIPHLTPHIAAHVRNALAASRR